MSGKTCKSGKKLYEMSNNLCNELDFRMVRLNERHNAFGAKPCSTSSKNTLGCDTVYDAKYKLNEAFKLMVRARALISQLAEIEGDNDFGLDGYGLYAVEPLPEDGTNK